MCPRSSSDGVEGRRAEALGAVRKSGSQVMLRCEVCWNQLTWIINTAGIVKYAHQHHHFQTAEEHALPLTSFWTCGGEHPHILRHCSAADRQSRRMMAALKRSSVTFLSRGAEKRLPSSQGTQPVLQWEKHFGPSLFFRPYICILILRLFSLLT